MPGKDNWVLARNILIYNELRAILHACNDRQIQPIVLAGAALAQTIYSHPAQRPMSDIDFLVLPADLPTIDDLLRPIGYYPETRRAGEVHYARNAPDFSLHLDCHIDLPYLSEFELAAIRSRARPTELAGEQALVLAPVDAIIYAVADDAFGHGRIGVTCLQDVQQIIRSGGGDFDWESLIRQVRRYRLEGLFYQALQMVRPASSRAVDIPETVIKYLTPQRRSGLTHLLYRCLTRGDGFEDTAPLLRFLTRPGRGALFASSFFPAPDFMAQRYGASSRWSACFHYPARFVSHGFRFGRLALRLLGS